MRARKANKPLPASRLPKARTLRLGAAVDGSRVRIVLVAALMGLAWLGLLGRAYWVQVVDGPRLASLASRQHVASEYVSGERGRIYDRAGHLLAMSVEFKSIFARPLEVENPRAAARVLANALSRPYAEVLRRLTERRKFVWIARQVGDKAASVVADASLSGVYLTTEYARQYPDRHLAGQLIGFVGLDQKGLEGVEKAFDGLLAGREASFPVQRDASGRRLYLDEAGREVDIDGGDLHLTIDEHVQFVAEEALQAAVRDNEAKSGTCLVVDVASGEILAWAEYPFFNPNTYRDSSPAQWRSRIAGDAVEPGSTLKAFVVAAALQEGVCDRDSLYYCENGRWRIKGATINDTHKYKWLPVHKVLRYSSNIGAAKIGEGLGVPKYYEYLSNLGFGRRTGLPLPGESRGILREPGEWTDVDLAAASFGQGVGVTALQLARAYLCLANDGVLRPLRLVRSPEVEREPDRAVFRPEVARQVLAMLRDVVMEDGTGTAARIEGLQIGGKTGTAQKAEPTGGYGKKYLASFVGFVPVDRPRFYIQVMVDEPQPSHYGGVVAAPAFKEIAVKSLAYLGELPDVGPLPAAAMEVAGDAENKRIVHKFEVGENAAGSVAASADRDDGRVPDVVGYSLRRAVALFARRGVMPAVRGEGLVVARQSPAPGGSWEKAREQGCVLWLARGDERS
ncbi:MAG: PASTA domain-containing protein [Desulfovibrionaceae bacterium]|jgi:cell division protein FtsI (penicillin-binding protein 3)|nr:PASTA domain-containing protein [Desulfovibrionaceae bacterium]